MGINLRKSETSSGKIIIAGKDAESNEQLVKQAEDNEYVLHTKSPGSPFVNIKGKANKEDLKEAAIFCVKYSQAWKKAKVKRDVEVHYFLGSNIFKNKLMAKGTFGVKKFNKIVVKKDEIQ